MCLNKVPVELWALDQYMQRTTETQSLIQSSFCFSVTDSVELWTMPEVSARCGENVTLTCNAKPMPLTIPLFEWFGQNKKCRYTDPKPDAKVLCQNTTNSLHYTLSLTLLNMMPDDRGNYTCKIHSNQGAMTRKTVVKVQGEYFCNQLFYCHLFSLSKCSWSLYRLLKHV